MGSHKVGIFGWKLVGFSRKSSHYSKFSLFFCLIRIGFTWLKPASTTYKLENASKNDSSAVLSFKL